MCIIFHNSQDGFEGRLQEAAGSSYAMIVVCDHDAFSKRSSAMMHFLNELGISALSISLYGTKTTPAYPYRLPLEWALKAYQQLISRDYSHIGIIGASLGALYGLQAACMIPLTCIIACSPQDLIYEAVDLKGHLMGESLFSYRSESLPYVSLYDENLPYQMGHTYELYETARERAAEDAYLPIENLKGACLVVSCVNDEIWGSREACKRIKARLEANHFRYGFKHVSYRYGYHHMLIEGVPLRRRERHSDAMRFHRRAAHQARHDLTLVITDFLERWKK